MTDADRIRAVVTDDEPLARKFLSDRLTRHDDIEVIAQCGNGWEAVEAVREFSPELLFLDIQMPELSGFGVLDELPKRKLPTVVFVTAYDEYAVRAFEVEALDYLLKPFDDARLNATLERVRKRLSTNDSLDQQTNLSEILRTLKPPERPLRIAVQEQERIWLLPVARIDWIEAAGKNVRLHTGDQSHLARQSISSLEKTLDPQSFMRISRSAIVNIDRVREIQRWFQGQYLLILASGVKLTTTRTYRQNLDRLLKRLT